MNAGRWGVFRSSISGSWIAIERHDFGKIGGFGTFASWHEAFDYADRMARQ
jgi:GT2 family glycosyltransferase